MSLTYRTARNRVAEAAEGALTEFRAYKAEMGLKMARVKGGISGVHSGPPVCSAVLFAISLVLCVDTSMYPGLITTMVLLLLVGVVINVFIVLRLEKTEREEVGNEVEALVSDYEKYIRLEDAKLGHSKDDAEVLSELDSEESGIRGTSNPAYAF